MASNISNTPCPIPGITIEFDVDKQNPRVELTFSKAVQERTDDGS